MMLLKFHNIICVEEAFELPVAKSSVLQVGSSGETKD